MQSPEVACREIEPPSSSAVPAQEKPFSPCRHSSTGRANSASRASSSPLKRTPATFWQTPQASGGTSLNWKRSNSSFDAKIGPDVIKAGEFDLSGMLVGIKAEAEARGARRIVFDAVDALLSLLDDPLAERREIYRLDDWLSESGLTGIITAKSERDDPFCRRRLRIHAVHGGLRGRRQTAGCRSDRLEIRPGNQIPRL